MFHRHVWSEWTSGRVVVRSPDLNTTETDQGVLVRECMADTPCRKRRQIRSSNGRQFRWL